MGLDYHKMDVKNNIGGGAQGLDYGKSEAHVRDENTVHNVDVQHFRTCAMHLLNLVCGAGEISRQQGGGDVIFHDGFPFVGLVAERADFMTNSVTFCCPGHTIII